MMQTEYGKGPPRIDQYSWTSGWKIDVFTRFTRNCLSSLAGRNRWVIYNEKHNVEYDGSMIPAEWFGWMHYKTDTPPTVVREL